MPEQLLKLNNNIGESEAKCSLLPKPALLISNGAQTPRADISEAAGRSSPEMSNARQKMDSSSLGCFSIPSVAQNQLNHEAGALVNTSGIPNGHLNSSVSSATSSDSPSNVISSPAGNISHADSDIRNNVDYIFGIDKCPPKVSCGGEPNPDIDVKWRISGISYTTESALNNIGGSIGSTSHGTCCFLRPNINGTSRDGEGPSGTQKREHVERRDSSSGNEGDLSDGEDYCIYTYKGNNEADEPINARPPINPGVDDDQAVAGQPNSGRSSPEMDFLEMDFDPGPSCEQDTGDSDLASINEDIQNLTMDNAESDPVLLNDLSKAVSRQIVLPEPAPSSPRERNVGGETDQHSNEASASSTRVPACTSPGSQCMPTTSAGLRKQYILLLKV